jgi:hypothetical protein
MSALRFALFQNTKYGFGTQRAISYWPLAIGYWWNFDHKVAFVVVITANSKAHSTRN